MTVPKGQGGARPCRSSQGATLNLVAQGEVVACQRWLVSAELRECVPVMMPRRMLSISGQSDVQWRRRIHAGDTPHATCGSPEIGSLVWPIVGSSAEPRPGWDRCGC